MAKKASDADDSDDAYKNVGPALATALTRAMEAKGLTPSDVYRAVPLSLSTVSALAGGRATNPPFSSVVHVARSLELDLTQLADETVPNGSQRASIAPVSPKVRREPVSAEVPLWAVQLEERQTKTDALLAELATALKGGALSRARQPSAPPPTRRKRRT